MPFDPDLTRRTVLVAGAGGLGAVALVACSGGGGGGGGAPATQPAGKPLIALSDVPVGQAKAVTLPSGGPAVVARPTSSSVVCFSAVCTHEGCTVQVEGSQLDCPCHGSQFNALTGAVLQGPAAQPLPAIPVKVSGTQVETA